MRSRAGRVRARRQGVHTVAGLPRGSAAPYFRLPSRDGGPLSLDDLRTTGKPVLLVFLDLEKEPDGAFSQKVLQWQKLLLAQLTLAIVSKAMPEEIVVDLRLQAMPLHVMLQRDHEISRLYRVDGTPSAVLVRPDGRIGSPVLHGATAINTLVMGFEAMS
jgi:hypothetical protein